MNDMPAPTIITAQPGWFRLWLDDETGELFGPEPVLAWEIVPRAYVRDTSSSMPYFVSVYPLTTSGRVSEDELLYLLRPDGRVEEVESRDWETLDLANVPKECAERVRTRPIP